MMQAGASGSTSTLQSQVSGAQPVLRPMHSKSGARGGQYRSMSFSFLPTYLRRIVKYRQMDFEYSFWLMLQLCISPKTAYRHTTYQKQTKNRWSRDDPAFLVICSFFMAISAAAYCVAFGGSIGHSIYTVVSAVAIDFVLMGVGIASVCWYLANTYLRTQWGSQSHTVDQKVEWLYAFDVHCNSFFPMFLMLYVLQFFLSPLLLSPSFVSCIFANILYSVALSYYHYMNFLGYSALPFLEHTEFFLYPIGLIAVATPLSVLLQFNPARFTLGIYFG